MRSAGGWSNFRTADHRRALAAGGHLRRDLLGAKAGIGSAVNDTTRLLGGTLGVAIIGSVYASLYASRLTSALPVGLPTALARTAHASIGGALTIAADLHNAGSGTFAVAVHNAATSAFFRGFSTANLVAAGISAAGAIMALAWLPAQPSVQPMETSDLGCLASPATASALD